MNGVTVTIDRVKEIMDALRTLTKEHVMVGVPMDEDHRDEGPFGNAQIGYVNENGSAAAGIPPRPHLEPGILAVSDKCAELMAKGAAGLLEGDDRAIEKGYNQAGMVAVSSVRKHITSGLQELADGTIEARKRKGFAGTKPLIFTGQYRNSITYVIRDR